MYTYTCTCMYCSHFPLFSNKIKTTQKQKTAHDLPIASVFAVPVNLSHPPRKLLYAQQPTDSTESTLTTHSFFKFHILYFRMYDRGVADPQLFQVSNIHHLPPRLLQYVWFHSFSCTHSLPFCIAAFCIFQEMYLRICCHFFFKYAFSIVSVTTACTVPAS